MSETQAGRPSAYKPEYDEMAYNYCLLGATDKNLAEFFGVSEQTINAWKQRYPSFLESLKSGKIEADARVAKSLFRKAVGYEHDAVKIFNDQGRPLVVPYVEKFAPDTTAGIFWLKNRQPQLWRDKQDLNHTSDDGSMSPSIDASKLSSETLKEILAARAKRD